MELLVPLLGMCQKSNFVEHQFSYIYTLLVMILYHIYEINVLDYSH